MFFVFLDTGHVTITLENRFFKFLQMPYSLAYDRIIHEETKLGPLLGKQNIQDKELFPSPVYRKTWIKNHDAALFYFCLLVFTCLLGHACAYPQDLIMKEYCT